MLWSSLGVQNRDIGNDASFQIPQAMLAKMEMVWAQNRTIELEGLPVEFRSERATKELRKKIKAVARLEAEVAVLKK